MIAAARALHALPDRGTALLPGGQHPRGVRQVRAAAADPGRHPRRPGARPPAGTPLRLVYSGKFAPRWNTLEMTELPGLLAARGVAAELHMIGDKIHNAPGDYQQRMRAALDTDGRDLARRALAGGRPAARGVLRHRAGLAAPRAGREPGAVDQGPGVRRRSGCRSSSTAPPCTRGCWAPTTRCSRPAWTDVVDVAAAAAADPRLYRLAADRTSRGRPSSSPWTGRRSGCAGTWPGRSAGPRQRRPPPDQTQGRGGRARPEVLHPAAGLPAAAAGPGGAAGPVGRAGQARRGPQPGTGGLGRRGDLRMVRAERRLVQQAQAARVTAAGPAAPVRAGLALPGPGQDQRGEPGGVREHALRPADPGADRLARGEGGDGAERHRRGPAGPAQARRRPVPPRPGRHRPVPQAAWTWPWTCWRNCAARTTGTCCSSSRGCRGSTGGCGRTRPSASTTPPRCAGCSGPRCCAGRWCSTTRARTSRPGCAGSASCCPPATTRASTSRPAEGMASRAVPVLRHWPGAETIYDTRWIHRGPAEMAAAIAALDDEAGWRAGR